MDSATDLLEELDFRELVQLSSDGLRRVVVLLGHCHDPAGVSGMEWIRHLHADGCVSPLLLATVGESGIHGECLLGRTSVPAEIHNALARAGRLQRLDLVTVFSGDLLSNQADLGKLAAVSDELAGRCRQLKPEEAMFCDYRVCFPRFPEIERVSFRGDSSATVGGMRVVVVPEDRRLASGMARPLDDNDPESFSLHVAVETLSLCGLWAGMRHDPLAMTNNPADAKPDLVRVARSQIRQIRLRCPAPMDMIENDNRLPAAADTTRTTVPETVVRNAARQLLPMELGPPSLDGHPTDGDNGTTIFRNLGSRVLRSARRLPRSLTGRISNEMATAVSELADTLVANPTLGRLWEEERSEDSTQEPSCDETAAPSEVSLSDSWGTVIQNALGLADGSPRAANFRAAAVDDSKQVVTSRRHLAGDLHASTLRQVVTALSDLAEDPVPDPDANGPTRPIGPDAPHDNDWINSRAATDSDNGDEASNDGFGDNAGEPTDQGSDPVQRPSRRNDLPSTPALLPLVSDALLAEKREAVRRVRQCHDRLAELSPDQQSHLKPEREVAPVVPVSLALGILLALLSWSVLFEPLRTFLDIGDVVRSGEARARLWIVPTAVVAMALLFLNIPRETARQQRHLIVGTATVVCVSMILLVWPRLLNWLFTADYSANATAAWLITALLLLVALICLFNLVGGGLLDTAAARLSSALILLYLTAHAVILLNDTNFRPDVLDRESTRLLVIITVTAAALIVMSFTVLTVADYRYERRRVQWHDEIQVLLQRHKDLHRQANAQDSVYTQWLATACALHRVFRLPYGEDPQSAPQDGDIPEAASAPRDPLVKLTIADCAPTPEGEERMREIVREEIFHPGWLYAQYHRVAELYRSRHGIAPEACAYPLRFNEALLETSDGDRWPFVQQLYRGDFDEALRSRITDFLEGDGLDDLFADVEAFQITAGAHPDETPLSLLSELAQDPAPFIPQSVLSTGGRINHGRDEMRSMLWWPQRLAAPDSSIESRDSFSFGHSGTTVHQAIRVDISEPIPLTAVTGE